jgi:hypothetical protein
MLSTRRIEQHDRKVLSKEQVFKVEEQWLLRN